MWASAIDNLGWRAHADRPFEGDLADIVAECPVFELSGMTSYLIRNRRVFKHRQTYRGPSGIIYGFTTVQFDVSPNGEVVTCFKGMPDGASPTVLVAMPAVPIEEISAGPNFEVSPKKRPF
jgi:hypothetical protein